MSVLFSLGGYLLRSTHAGNRYQAYACEVAHHSSGLAFCLMFAACDSEPGTTGGAGPAGDGGASNVAGSASDGGGGAADGGASEGGDGPVGGGGGAGTPPDLCSEYADVVMFAELPYNDYTRRTTAENGGFPPDRVFVLPMTLADTPASYATQGNTSMFEWQGPPSQRHMTLSRSPCDFRPADPTGENGPIAEGAGLTPVINWNVGVEPLALVPGETYYFSYRNTNCPQASCDAATSTNWPH